MSELHYKTLYIPGAIIFVRKFSILGLIGKAPVCNHCDGVYYDTTRNCFMVATMKFKGWFFKKSNLTSQTIIEYLIKYGKYIIAVAEPNLNSNHVSVIAFNNRVTKNIGNVRYDMLGLLAFINKRWLITSNPNRYFCWEYWAAVFREEWKFNVLPYTDNRLDSPHEVMKQIGTTLKLIWRKSK